MDAARYSEGGPLLNRPPTRDRSSIDRVRRSAVACQPCRQRKLKCDVIKRGRPCSSCITDDRHVEECSVIPGKRSKRGPVVYQRGNESIERTNNHPTPQNPRVSSDPGRVPSLHWQSSPSQTRNQPLRTVDLREAARGGQVSGGTSNRLTERPAKEWNPLRPLYFREITDNQASFTFVLRHATTGVPENHNIIIPKDIDDSLLPEDLYYLQVKGVFSIPPTDVCDELLRSYFLHIHFCLPIINARELLLQYVDGGPASINLMLLWAVFSAASHYATPELWQKAGFNNQLEMCQCYFTRTKLLYDMNYAKDCQISAQSVLLLSYFPVPLKRDFRTGWHLLGIAIGLCQASMPNFKRVNGQNGFSAERRDSIWPRLWFACTSYDGWLSVSSGLGLRVHECENDVPLPSCDDILDEFEGLPIRIKHQYLPSNSSKLLEYYLAHINLAGCVRRFFSRANLAKDDVAALGDVALWEADIERIEQGTMSAVAEDSCSPNKTTRLAAFHFQACLAGVHLVILEPYFLNSLSRSATSLASNLPEGMVFPKITGAAARVITALEMIIGLDIGFQQRYLVVTVMIPVTQFYLIQLGSIRPVERKVARHKVNTCFAIWDEIQKTNLKAPLFTKLLRQAFQKVLDSAELSDQLPLSPEHESSRREFATVPDLPVGSENYNCLNFEFSLENYGTLVDPAYM